MWTHIKETSKSVLLALCGGNSQVTGEFPAQMASNAYEAWDNIASGLAPSHCWTNDDMSSIGPLGTDFSEFRI